MGHWYNEQLQVRAEFQYIFPDGRVLDADNRDTSPVGGWEWHNEAPKWWPVKKIYTETPFEPWKSSFGEISPVEPRSEGWVFPANVGWEEELTARGMEWEYIEVTKEPDGTWESVKATAGGYWDTLKGWFS